MVKIKKFVQRIHQFGDGVTFATAEVDETSPGPFIKRQQNAISDISGIGKIPNGAAIAPCPAPL